MSNYLLFKVWLQNKQHAQHLEGVRNAEAQPPAPPHQDLQNLGFNKSPDDWSYILV